MNEITFWDLLRVSVPEIIIALIVCALLFLVLYFVIRKAVKDALRQTNKRD